MEQSKLKTTTQVQRILPAASGLGAIIVSYNSGSEAVDCAESLLAAANAAGMPLRLVIVDNASTDDTVARLRAWASGAIPYKPPADTPFGVSDQPKPLMLAEGPPEMAPVDGGITLIHVPFNRGFAGGVNVGLAYLHRFPDLGHFWVINPDSMVPPETLQVIRQWLVSAPRYGLAGGRVCYMHQPDRVQIDGGIVDMSTGVTRNLHLGRNATKCRAPDPDKLDFITGASMIASREFYESVGPMREDYFLYYEEVDWALRGRHLPLSYLKGMVVYHRAGTAIGSPIGGRLASPFSLYFKHRGQIRFVRRFNRRALPKARLYALAIALRLFVRDQAPAHAHATLAGAFGLAVPEGIRSRLSPEAAALAFATTDD